MSLLFISNLILALLFLPGSFAGNVNCFRTQRGSATIPNRNLAPHTHQQTQRQEETYEDEFSSEDSTDFYPSAQHEHTYEYGEKSQDIVEQENTCQHGRKFKNIIVLNTNAQIHYTEEPTHLIGTGGTTGIRGGIGGVYHAYLPTEHKCIALKISKTNSAMREIEIFEHFAKLPLEENNRIIKYYGYSTEDVEDENSKTFIALELGRRNLTKYQKKTQHVHYLASTKQQLDKKFSLVTKILIGAAKAISQFNRHALHLDIKLSNFVVSRRASREENVKLEDRVKILDFGCSVLNADLNKEFNFKMDKVYRAPEIRGIKNINELANAEEILTPKLDVWAFGIMGFEFLQEGIPDQIIEQIQNSGNYNWLDDRLNRYKSRRHPNSNLDIIIKKCLQINPAERPDMDDIIQQLENLYREIKIEV